MTDGFPVTTRIDEDGVEHIVPCERVPSGVLTDIERNKGMAGYAPRITAEQIEKALEAIRQSRERHDRSMRRTRAVQLCAAVLALVVVLAALAYRWWHGGGG